MKGISNMTAAGCTLLLLCHCASQDEVRRLNYQLRSMNQKVQTVESKTEEKLKEVESKASDKLMKDSASSANRLETVAEEARQLREVNQENIERFNNYKAETEDKIAKLQAALEQMQSENNHLSKSNDELVRSLEIKIEQLSSGLQQASQNKVQDAAQRAREAESRAKEAAEKAAEARKKAEFALRSPAVGSSEAAVGIATIHPESKKVRKTAESAPVQAEQEDPDDEADQVFDAPRQDNKKEEQVSAAKQAAPVAEAEEAEDGGLLGKGMSSFKEKQYKKAYKLFEQHLAGQPKKNEAAKTLYLMGECLFNQGEYDLAILEYQKVISNYSGNPHSSAALLRQAMSFEKLTDKETAKIIYGKLISEYPDSREAKVARERLEKL